MALSSLAASIVLKATIVMAMGLIGALLARRSRAAIRHLLLAAAFGAATEVLTRRDVRPGLPISVALFATGALGALGNGALVVTGTTTISATGATVSPGTGTLVLAGGVTVLASGRKWAG